jgi:hypothetical protein
MATSPLRREHARCVVLVHDGFADGSESKEHAGATRLISRNRFRLPTLAERIGMLPMEPGSLVMEQKMLRGIKKRAERLNNDLPRSR